MTPTFVVIPGLNRHQMTAYLIGDLQGQGATILLYDNGSSPTYDFAGCEVIEAAGWPLHRMWAHGIQTARERSGGICDIAVLNNDLRVQSDLLTRLSEGLRCSEDVWISYPDVHDIGQTVATHASGQTLAGYAFMIRGESALRVDERFHFWYGDWDLEKQAHAAGKLVVTVGDCHVRHLEPTLSTRGERLDQARRDEKEFAAKWGLDPESLFLARNPGFGR